VSFFLAQDSFVQAALTFAFVGAAAMILALATRVASRRAGHALTGVSTSLLSPLGALFGLTAGFLGAAVWQNHGEAVAAAGQEARALAEAWVAADSIPDPVRTQTQHGIDDYVHIVVTKEWPLLTKIRSANNPVSNAAGDVLMKTVRNLVSPGQPPSMALSATDAALRKAYEARANRIHVAVRRISPVQLAATMALGVLLMALVAVVHHGSRQSQLIALLLVSLAVAVTVTTVVVNDNPFAGYLSFTASDFSDLAEYGRPAP
jgi:hypothetical protein